MAEDGSSDADKNGAKIMARLEAMAQISESPDVLTRRCYVPEHRQINDLVARWMRAAGMSVHEDAVGNVVGRYEGRTPDAAAIMIGSHGDTVVDAGRYDGALGVLSAIHVVEQLHARGTRFDNAIEVICFADEEGVRFHSTFLGSCGVAGTFDRAVLERSDKDGITLARAMRDFGLDPDRIADAARRPGEIRCYLEVHIEQGPVLEAEDRATCAVTAIAGADRMKITAQGTAGHAGTVPMGRRADALSAACEAILALERIAAGHPDAVATVGQIEAAPGASNVIPGRAIFSVDIRAAEDAVRADAIAAFFSELDRIAAARGITFARDHAHTADGVTCAPWLLDQVEGAMRDLGDTPFRLSSGAGHDAVAMSDITDVGMIFVRCKGGISHSPLEHITPEDAQAGADLLLRTVERIGGMTN